MSPAAGDAPLARVRPALLRLAGVVRLVHPFPSLLDGAVVVLVALVVFFNDHDRARVDVTSGRVSSLSPKTVEIIRNLNAKHPIYVDAFVSAHVPELYAQTRFNLVSLLKEFDALSRGKVKVRLHENLEPFSEEASMAPFTR